MIPAIEQRWSPRAFDPVAEVSREQMGVLLEAARWAASHGNTQPARFLLGYRGDDTHARILGALRPRNRTWAQRASVLMIGAVVTADERGELPNTVYGLGLAVQNLVLQAVDLGLVAHQIGGFDKDAVRVAFALPDDALPVVAIAVGHLGDVADLPEELQVRETRPRRRRPLTELVFSGTWGEPAFSVEPADEPEHE
ncbi:nitroreductase family protein [Umezawaea endophytica]|uniref:Nitroreductase family protein n=1 Tax=Umezawaea endophytica TaxID=1654476 RepID=A0A9X2VV07_9PSEU|nr:nitroreductase family protein [Umezawaea endophytica]MCS7483415.1 nitroreductase family protein [Umezawaea endophytica]